ncbi:MAG TPA: hypothetical protein VNF24_11440 [Candidatus Acidoferrales bacterium]|nr:hypothetical protein [Candidatus Acidoferrales bacterium]
MDDPALDAAVTLVRVAAARGVPLRIVGGLAVRYLTPDFPARTRSGQDLDLASTGEARRDLTTFLGEHDYQPDKNFNALYGHKQLYFRSPDGSQTLDVLVDRFEMCHTLDFTGRLTRVPVTLDPTDLLLSKLQIVQLNAKDAQDVCYLLAVAPLSASDTPGDIGLGRIGELMGSDWGWWRTVTANLDLISKLIDERVEGPAGPLVPDGHREEVAGAVVSIRAHCDRVPKSRKWKWRAAIGDRKRWYEQPEEVDHD